MCIGMGSDTTRYGCWRLLLVVRRRRFGRREGIFREGMEFVRRIGITSLLVMGMLSANLTQVRLGTNATTEKCIEIVSLNNPIEYPDQSPRVP